MSEHFGRPCPATMRFIANELRSLPGVSEIGQRYFGAAASFIDRLADHAEAGRLNHCLEPDGSEEECETGDPIEDGRDSP